MAGKRVIVKRLSAIQNLGAMDVLCTDKLAAKLGFVVPPPEFFVLLAIMTAAYLLMVEGVKRYFYHRLEKNKRLSN